MSSGRAAACGCSSGASWSRRSSSADTRTSVSASRDSRSLWAAGWRADNQPALGVVGSGIHDREAAMPGEQLRITGGPAAGSQLDIGQELQIGRSAGGEGRLGDDPEISRQHAKLSRNPQGQLVVEDLGSTNGTYVNGQRITGPTPLNPGDTLQMGRSTLTVEGAAGAGQATAIGAVPIPPSAPP